MGKKTPKTANAIPLKWLFQQEGFLPQYTDLMREADHTDIHRALTAEMIKEARAAAKFTAPKNNPRPREGPTEKSVTVAAMRGARKQSQSFKDFLAGAENGSVDGLSLERTETRGVVRYEIACDDVVRPGSEPPKKVSESTLKGWWSEANYSSPK